MCITRVAKKYLDKEKSKMAKLYVVGIGPGGKEHLTLKAVDVLQKCSVVVGYTFYIELIQCDTKN